MDLRRIVKAIAIHNPKAAQDLGDLIIRIADSLSFFPERYPKVRQRLGIRRFIVKTHFKVFYRIVYVSQTVEVLRCWDGYRANDPSLFYTLNG